MLQQLSGINAVMFYSNQIFANTTIAPTTGTALVGVVNMVSTLLSSILLAFIGRRTLLWTLSFAMSATLIGLGIAYQEEITGLEVTLVLLYVTLFEFSLGPILWIYMSEIMTDKGVSLGTLTNWVFTIIIAVSTSALI
jgi:SP family arabinose:H+ symporter-like MFS transporter